MIFAANLKCNHTRASFRHYADTIENKLSQLNPSDSILVFAPASAFLEQKCAFTLGAQNFYPVDSGSFTGEIGKSMLDEFCITSVMIGHSERRMLGESSELLKAKFEFAKKNAWQIIYCIGENLNDYESENTKEVLSSQLENIDLDYEKLIIAYEPVWAIGTGKSADLNEIDEILKFLGQKSKAPLLYGGSVNAKNIAEICELECCSGVLVGTASWDADNFLNLIDACKK